MTQRSVSEYGILGTSLTIYFVAPVSGKKSRAIVIIIIQPTAAARVGPNYQRAGAVPLGAVLRHVALCVRMRPRPWRACGVRARDMSSILLCESHGACVRTHASECHISRIRRHRLTTPSHIVRLCPGRASHERVSMPGGFKSTQAKANKRNAAKSDGMAQARRHPHAS